MDMFHYAKDKRRSLSGTNTPRSGSPSARKSAKESPRLAPMKPATLEVDMESPPLVFYGPPGQSTGALLSGQLILNPSEPEISIKTFEMTLLCKVTANKPVKADCPECKVQTTELFRWKFLSEPTHFSRKKHHFPFSYLLPGHLPSTTHGALGSVDYVLCAEAITNFAEPITVQRTLKIQRAIMPTADKTAVRIFPPTNLVVNMILPSVVHPIGEFPLEMRVTGVVGQTNNVTTRWRIRRMHWRIDETFKMVSEACHDLDEGWKTDFDTEGGQIECEFPISMKPGSNPVCDVTAPNGLDVFHQLILELIVSEEQCSSKNPRHGIPTGNARVLRMQFKLLVTERAGMGISWDEEQPPMYEDVPISPPVYAKADDYDGEPLPEEDLDRLT